MAATKSKWRKIKSARGFVALRHNPETNEFRIRFSDERGRDTKRLLPCDNLKDALEIVRGYNREIAADRHVPGLKALRAGGVLINEAMQTAIDQSNADSYTSARYLSSINLFLAWMAGESGSSVYWSQITSDLLLRYVRHMQDDCKLANSTIQSRLRPLSIASGYWAMREPETFRDVYRLSRIKLKVQPKENPAVLEDKSLKVFLNWMRRYHRQMFPMAVLAATTGMRLLEAGAIRYCDVDWSRKTVRIAKTETHSPKTAASYRTIPVGKTAIRAISAHVKQQTVQDVDPAAPLFLNDRGKPWNRNPLIWRWGKLIKEAREDLELPEGFSTRRLRASFVTVASGLNVKSDCLERYIGHQGKSTMARHYESITVEDLRREVVSKVESFYEKVFQKETGNILETSETGH